MRFVIYQDYQDKYRADLRTPDGQTLIRTIPHETIQDVKDTITYIQDNAANSEIQDLTG